MRSRVTAPARRLQASRLALAGLTLLAASARAEIIVGPGAVAGPVSVSIEGTTIVGSTTVTAGGATAGTNVTGFLLTVDSLLGPSPGSIVLQTLNGNALNANGGNISLTNNVAVTSQNGHGVLANNSSSTVNANSTFVQTTGTGAGFAAIGGTINATGVTVNNLGNSTPTTSAGHGVIAESGGTVTLNAGTNIATGAFNAVGLGASGANSQVIATAAIPVTMNGRGAMGVYLHDGGQVALVPNMTLQFSASNSVGVAGDNTTSPLGVLGDGLTANFNAVPTSGQAGGTGMAAFNAANLSVKDFTVTGAGAAAGAWARQGSTISLTGASSISIAAPANPTYYTLQTAFLVTSSGSVGSIFGVTSGLPIGGLLSNGGTINSTGTTVNVTSTNGVGAYAALNSALSLINLSGGSIETTGTSSFGLHAGENGRITASGTSVATSGGGAALFVFTVDTGLGSIQLTNATVQATGANTTGLASLNLSSAQTGQVSLTGGSLTSAASTAVLGTGGPVDVTIANAATVTGNDRLIDAQFNAGAPQPTSVRMNASGASVLSGNAAADAQSTATISLATASRWTGAALNATSVDIDGASRWDVTDTSVLTGNLVNAGAVAFTPAGAGLRTLTTTNYAGGGTLELHTLVAGDGAPSDRLVIAGGTVTGTTSIVVTNTAGTGALTSANGILVVEATGGALTPAGAFTLAQPLIVGGYVYTLHRGSVDASGPQNWYLRSTAVPGAPTIGPVTPGNGQASVAFSAPASDGGSPITGYTATCGALTATGTASPLVVTGLTNGMAYNCSVTATNAVGIGPASATASVTPRTIPGAPTIGVATAGNMQASVAFTAPASNGGSAITSYTATCGAFSASGAASPLVVTGLANGTAYNCSVTATNVAGTGPASATASVTPRAVPDPPTIGVVTAGNGQASVAFTAPASNGGSPITGYTATCGVFTATGAASPLVVTGLTNGTAYNCSVTATNATGTGPASATASVTPFAPGTTTFTGPSATGTGTINASFTGGGGGTCGFTTPQFIGAPPGAAPIPPTAPANTTFPHGLFDFRTTGCTAGATLSFTITYPVALPAGTTYWKYGPTASDTSPHWYTLPATVAGNTATFTITDGGLGDDDLVANGTIVDQGGPGVPGAPGTATAVPTLGEWMLMLLAALMLATVVLRGGRPEGPA